MLLESCSAPPESLTAPLHRQDRRVKPPCLLPWLCFRRRLAQQGQSLASPRTRAALRRALAKAAGRRRSVMLEREAARARGCERPRRDRGARRGIHEPRRDRRAEARLALRAPGAATLRETLGRGQQQPVVISPRRCSNRRRPMTLGCCGRLGQGRGLLLGVLDSAVRKCRRAPPRCGRHGRPGICARKRFGGQLARGGSESGAAPATAAAPNAPTGRLARGQCGERKRTRPGARRTGRDSDGWSLSSTARWAARRASPRVRAAAAPARTSKWPGRSGSGSRPHPAARCAAPPYVLTSPADDCGSATAPAMAGLSRAFAAPRWWHRGRGVVLPAQPGIAGS